METLKKFGNDITTPGSPAFKGAVGVLIFIILCVIFYYKQTKYYEQNPCFVRSGHDASKYKKIETTRFPKSNDDTQMTMFWWMYVDNLHQGYKTYKHVLSKGSDASFSAGTEQCPAVWIDTMMNDLIIKITTTTQTDEFSVKDFPVRAWFSMAVVTKGTQVDIYKNGKLEMSKNLSGYAQLNTGDLHICGQNHGSAEDMAASEVKNGFSGKISCIHYFPVAKGPRLIGWKHANGHVCINIFEKIYKSLTGAYDKLRNSITVDVDLKVDPDIPTYTTTDGAKCNGTTLEDLGPVSLEDAQIACNLNPACDCITQMTQPYGTLEKGNMRLINNPSIGSRTVTESGFVAHTVNRSMMASIYDGLTQNATMQAATGDVMSELTQARDLISDTMSGDIRADTGTTEEEE